MVKECLDVVESALAAPTDLTGPTVAVEQERQSFSVYSIGATADNTLVRGLNHGRAVVLLSHDPLDLVDLRKHFSTEGHDLPPQRNGFKGDPVRVAYARWDQAVQVPLFVGGTTPATPSAEVIRPDVRSHEGMGLEGNVFEHLLLDCSWLTLYRLSIGLAKQTVEISGVSIEQVNT